MDKKNVFEWVLSMTKGDDVILTENQYAIYEQNISEEDTRQILFGDISLNPVYVVSAYKRPAQYLKRKYPCSVCHESGRDISNADWCSNCQGSQVDLPKKP